MRCHCGRSPARTRTFDNLLTELRPQSKQKQRWLGTGWTGVLRRLKVTESQPGLEVSYCDDLDLPSTEHEDIVKNAGMQTTWPPLTYIIWNIFLGGAVPLNRNAAYLVGAHTFIES